MTSHRATVTMPARDSRRGPSARPGSSSPPAPTVEPRANHRTVPAAMPPAEPAARFPSIDGAPAEVAERYLAPALKAAAAARARTACIRAAAWAAAAGPASPYPREWRFAPPDQSSAPPPDPSPAAFLPAPAPAHDLQMAEMTAAWVNSRLTITGAAGLPALPPTRGLSVAEAACASWIAFQPLRRQPLALPAPPAKTPPLPAEPLAVTSIPTATGKPAAPAKAVTSPTTAAPEAPGTPAAPAIAPKTVAPATPTKAVSRPGLARLLPAEAVRRAVPERPPRQQRFAKTIADLQRYQAATRPSEPWGNVVPRPAVPQANPATSDSRWSRLWSRR